MHLEGALLRVMVVHLILDDDCGVTHHSFVNEIAMTHLDVLFTHLKIVPQLIARSLHLVESGWNTITIVMITLVNTLVEPIDCTTTRGSGFKS